MNSYNRSSRSTLGVRNSHLTSAGDLNLNVTHNDFSGVGRDVQGVLEKHVAFGALHNSKERFDPPKCHPDTRTAVLETIGRWARGQADDTKPILWLRGAAGAGKSAIAQTRAEWWDQEGRLVACFFFSRTAPGRNESSAFAATLAYQVASHISLNSDYLQDALRRDVGILKKTLKSQLLELVVPAFFQTTGTYVIVIDGLDECCIDTRERGYESQQREILESIAAICQIEDNPLRFLIASRPERQIRTSFAGEVLSRLTHTIDLSSEEDSDADIELYLDCKFDEIRAQHPYLPRSWPPAETIAFLVAKSSGHFIYPATVMRHLQRPRQDPRSMLQEVLKIATHRPTSYSPFAEIDALYTYIMQAVLPTSISPVLDLFGFLCYAGGGTRGVGFWTPQTDSPAYLSRYLFLPEGALELHLVDLHSVVHVPPHEESGTAPLRFFHASFSEFLTDPIRSQQFHLDEPKFKLNMVLVRLRHLFIQSSFQDGGESIGYSLSGIFQSFCDDLPTFASPSREIMAGICALFGSREAYTSYMRSINLCDDAQQDLTQNDLVMQYWSETKKEDIEEISSRLKKWGVDPTAVDRLFSRWSRRRKDVALSLTYLRHLASPEIPLLGSMDKPDLEFEHTTPLSEYVDIGSRRPFEEVLIEEDPEQVETSSLASSQASLLRHTYESIRIQKQEPESRIPMTPAVRARDGSAEPYLRLRQATLMQPP